MLIIIAALCAASAAVAAGFVLLRVSAMARGRQSVDVELRGLTMQLEMLKSRSVDLERDLRQDLAIARNEQANAAQSSRGEIIESVTRFTHIMQQQFASLTQSEAEQLKAFGERLRELQHVMQQQLVAAAAAQATQSALAADRLAELTQTSEQRLEAVRITLEQRLDILRNENVKKLDEMRATVDEKLQATLEQRLGASFKQVSERLEQVHRGLGEMQSLAIGVGDLKRVLQNVKTRGGWGEVQLGALLSEMLTPQQYESNVSVRPGTAERVEYAIRLPGRSEESGPCWLPIDCKFPLEDWQRLQDALERADAPAAIASRKNIASFLREQARKIRDKYVEPPYTTDFAILFLPTEGLYAEMMAQPGFADTLQREYRVLVTGPMNLAAFINSLQLGFRTMAIERRSSEVWKVLGAVKTEFGKFGEILAKTKEKLDQVGKTLDDAGRKSTTIARKLRDVEALPEFEADRLLTGGPDNEVLEIERAAPPELVP
ncbi:MAG: DNA recombination protein RmuC [Pseudomonadota bacterium]|nr:DNA recombination protein RmuC [Pseudomonadota bacterium]